MILRISQRRHILSWGIDRTNPADMRLVARAEVVGMKRLAYHLGLTRSHVGNWLRGTRGITMGHHAVLQTLDFLGLKADVCLPSIVVKGRR